MPRAAQLDDLDQFVKDYRAKGVAGGDDDDDIDSFTQNFYASQQAKLKTPIPFASPIPGRSLSDSAAKLGQPLTTLTPPPQDTSTTPINVFSGEAQAPGMRTEEEKAQLGTISARPKKQYYGYKGVPTSQGADETVGEVARRVVPRAFSPTQWQDPNDMQILHPEGLMSPEEQRENPVTTGIAQAVGGLTTPENIGLMAVTGGTSEIPGLLGSLAKVGISGLFGTQMLKGAYDSIPGIQAARDRGDWSEVKRLATLAGLNVAMGAAALGHAGHSAYESGAEVGGSQIPVQRLGVPESAVSERADVGIDSATKAALSGVSRETPATGNTSGNDIDEFVASWKQNQQPVVGAGGEELAPESMATLRAQTAALANGTNPIVYFPKSHELLPEPPENSRVTVVPGNAPGAGTYYHAGGVDPQQIRDAVANGTYSQLLGYRQPKEDAIASGRPTAVVARSADGTELKSAAVDGSNPQIIAEQSGIFARQFPDAKIGIEPIENVVAGRRQNQSPPQNSGANAPVEDNGIPARAADLQHAAQRVASLDPKLAAGMRDLANGRIKSVDDLRSLTENAISDPAAKAEFTKILDDYEARTDTRDGAAAGSSSPDELDRFLENYRVGSKDAPEAFDTKALESLINGKDAPELAGTRYSGLAPAALKGLLPEALRDKIDEETAANQRARNLQGGLYDLDSQSAADLLRARNVMREAPGTPADLEAVYHHLEDPNVKLTAQQENVLNSYLRPLMEQSERIHEKLTDGGTGQVENYVHRIPVGKGNLLDRVLSGEGKLGSGSGLSKATSSKKNRVMMALEDEAGDRRVVAIKDGDVTAFDNGKPENMGRIRGLESQGLKSKGQVLNRELEPIFSEIAKLSAERRVLTSAKKREAVSQRRIENIDNRLAELREAAQDKYRSDDGSLLTEQNLRDRVFLDKDGKQWRITQATTKEIEANTNLRYYKNALASTVVNYLANRKAERAYDFLESYKGSDDFQNVAARVGSGDVPAGWRSTTLPQFHGYAFEPHTAEVLDWYAKRMRSEGPNLYRQVGDFLRTAIFFSPLIHTPNIGVHWLVEGGVSRFAPQNWGRVLRTGSRAIDAVIHQNPDFLSALDEGAPLQSARLDTGSTTKLLIERMGRELEANPTAGQKVAKALSYANPVKLISSIYRFSKNATWLSNDIAMLQATYEHMERTGSPFKGAVTDVAKHIPDYRLPTRIFNSTAVAKLMSSPELTMFGAYHYGALRSYAEMTKGLVSEEVSPAERMRSLDRLAMLGLVTFVVYPQLDKLAKLITGDKTAEFRRAGASTFIDTLAKLARGDKQPVDALFSVATPAAHTKALAQLAINRDLHSGKQIVNWSAPASTIAKQIGRYGLQNVAPLDQGMQITEGRKSFGQEAASFAGIKTKVPTPALALARRFASDASSSEAPDVDTLERSFLRRRYEEALRDKSITPLELARDRAAGKISAQDQALILKRAARTPLQNVFRSLNPEQALQVWDKATPEEKQQVRPLFAIKLSGVEKLPAEKRAAIRDRITAALHQTASFAGIPQQAPASRQTP